MPKRLPLLVVAALTCSAPTFAQSSLASATTFAQSPQSATPTFAQSSQSATLTFAQSPQSATPTFAQPPAPPRTSDIFSAGFGLGLDYGGLGLNLTVYPQENIGLFGGFGYALAGVGYNAGVKLRLLPGHSQVRPFLTGMYGYNAAVYVANSMQYDKLFYGPSFGAGVDIGAMREGRGYLSLAILIPIRSPDVDNYINSLKTNYGVTFNNTLLPIAFSIGYKIIID
jgi:hypothetical protein